MARDENMPWEWLLLGMLDESGRQTALQDIYMGIEEQYPEIKKAGSDLINPKLFQKDPKAGNRPKYQQTVRGCLNVLKKRGQIERVDRGMYRITKAGTERLKEY